MELSPLANIFYFLELKKRSRSIVSQQTLIELHVSPKSRNVEMEVEFVSITDNSQGLGQSFLYFAVAIGNL